MKRLYYILILFSVLFCSFFLSACEEAKATINEKGPLLWDLAFLSEIQISPNYYKIRNDIVRQADIFLDKPSISVIQKKGIRSTKDKHNYYSIAIYWWPDEEDATKPYVWKDGKINPEYKDYDYYSLTEVGNRCKQLSMAYFLTKERKYHDKLIEQVRIWFIDSVTYMYPNFNYGQVTPGHNDGLGQPAGLSEARFLIPIFESVLLSDYIEPLEKDLMDELKSWCYDFAKWMLTSEIGKNEKKAKDNHAFIYDALLLYLSSFSEHVELSKEVESGFRQQLKEHINWKGQFERELIRTQAYSYSIVCLTEIINSCIILEKQGVKMFNKNRDVLSPAIKYLAQYVGHREAFPYQQLYDWNYYEQELLFQISRLRSLKGGKRLIREFKNLELTMIYEELMLQ